MTLSGMSNMQQLKDNIKTYEESKPLSEKEMELILVPSFVRCIKALVPGEAIPVDENFLPRSVEIEKNVKQKKVKGC